MKHLPPEVLDHIFRFATPVLRDSRSVELGIRGRFKLRSYALVCKAWRGPAQRRLYSLVNIRSKKALEGLAQRLEDIIGAQLRIVSIALHHVDLATDDQLTARDLLEYAALFAKVQELFVETQSKEDDSLLADFIGGCRLLTLLSIRHTWGTWKFSPRSDDGEESFNDDNGTGTSQLDQHTSSSDSQSCEPRLDTLADATSIFKNALPKLASLEHLCLSRLQFSLSAGCESTLFCLKQLYMHRCPLNPDIMQFLLPGLLRLTISHPTARQKQEVIDALRHSGQHLHTLTLVLPWIETSELLGDNAQVPSPLLGLSNDVLPLCPHLRRLCLQDSQLRPGTLGALRKLQDITLAVGKPSDVDPLLGTSDHPLLQVVGLASSHFTHQDWLDFQARQTARGLQVSDLLAINEMVTEALDEILDDLCIFV